MKQYIKMNNNDNQLSLGNTCRIIKQLSTKKNIATQTDIFCAIFNIENANDSTVNNYCIGCRSIGEEYKKIYMEIKNQTQPFIPILNNLLFILGLPYQEKQSKETLNQNETLKILSQKLYNLAKNDRSILPEKQNQIYKYFKENNYIECLKLIFIIIVLEKKQPIYIEDIVKNTIENLLNNTKISLNELESFLQIQFNDGLNYNYSLKKLAKENNAYACFEIGLMEYNGEFTGTPNYEKSYTYVKIAANQNHPRANYLIAKMLLEGKIGTQSNEDITLAYHYLKTAESLGNIAALNQLGLYYKNNKKDNQKAIEYFKKAASYNYPYAFNNLGKLAEQENNHTLALSYYEKSANLEESWALNKTAEYYREGIHCKKDLQKAYFYYTKALNVPLKLQSNYAKYNLAKYFYLNGCYEIGIEKNTKKALSLLEDASTHNLLEAKIELLTYYTKTYFQTKDKNILIKINQLLIEIENHPLYTTQIKKDIETTIINIKQKEKVNRKLFQE